MNLIQIHIENFKKFKDVVIPLTKSHLILGTNDSGKSTILQAINIALLDIAVNKEDLIDKNKKATLTLTFAIDNKIETLKYESKGTKGNTERQFLPNESNKKNYENKHIFIPSNIIEAEKIAQDIAIQNNPKIPELMNELKKLLEDDISKLLNSKNEEADKLMVVGENSSFVASTDIKSTSKILTIEDNLTLSQRGDGYRKNISISLLKKLKNKSSLIMVDEIENHFSKPNVENIIHRITKNNSVIFTSHRLETKLNDILGITFLGENKTNDIAGAIQSLKIEVEKYERVILVEGKTDIYYINKYIKLKRQKDEKFNGIVVQVNGVSNMLPLFKELSKHICVDKIYPIQDGDQRDNQDPNIIYLKKDNIEEYRNDMEELSKELENTKISVKNLASIRLDFLNENHPLFIELDEILNKKEK